MIKLEVWDLLPERGRGGGDEKVAKGEKIKGAWLYGCPKALFYQLPVLLPVK